MNRLFRYGVVAGVVLLWTTGISVSQSQNDGGPDARFDKELQRAVEVTANPCYGQFFELVVPQEGSTRKPVVVMFGTVVRAGQEGLYQVRARANRDVVWFKKGNSATFGSLADPQSKVLKKWPERFGCS